MTIEENIFKVIGGQHVAAVATVSDGRPEVRFMALEGYEDLVLVGATMKSSRKVAQISKNPAVSLSIWSGKQFTDPYVIIRGNCRINDDLETKKKYWNPMREQYFKTVDNPDYVNLTFMPDEIEYIDPATMQQEVWVR
jgi:general stress protein 26